MNKETLFLIALFSLMLQSCLDLRSCNWDLSARYHCNHDKDAVNYLDIKEDGTFYHYYKKKSIELSNSGTWKRSDSGRCIVELEGWKNYNEKGVDHDNFMVAHLYISGNYLDISPDGESSTSFKKEKK